MAKNDLERSLDADNFHDIEGLSTSKLNFGLWIVDHRRAFIIGLLAFLALAGGIFVFYSGYNYIDYFFFGGQRENQDIINLINSPAIDPALVLRNQAQKLQANSGQVFLKNGQYDFWGQIKNPNDKFLAYADYCFVDGAKELACAQTFIMPGEIKNFLSLGNNLGAAPANFGLIIKNTKWERMNVHTYPNWPKFAADHLNFTTSDFDFHSGKTSGLSDKLNIDSLTFNVKNNSAFSYWQVPLNIVLYNGTTPVTVLRYVVDKFYSSQTQIIRLSWVDSIDNADSLQIYPDLNIVDDSIYIKY